MWRCDWVLEDQLKPAAANRYRRRKGYNVELFAALCTFPSLIPPMSSCNPSCFLNLPWALLDRPISSTLRLVESPSGMPKATRVQPISLRPGSKRGPLLAQGAAKAASDSPEGGLSGSEGGCKLGHSGWRETDSYLVRSRASCHSQQHSAFVLLEQL